MIITSKSNPRIKEIAALKDKKSRRESGNYMVEGFKMVKEAMSLNKDIVCLVGTEAGLSQIDATGYDSVTVSEPVMAYVSDEKTPQGVIAVLRYDDTCHTPSGGINVLLDGISDPGNMGTIIRSCAAAGVENVYLADCCDPYSPKAVRSSMSGIFRTRVSEVKREDIPVIFKDIPLIVADMRGENMYGFTVKKPCCLVVGNEANGVSDFVKDSAACTVSIPMKNGVESLNAGVALSVLLYRLNKDDLETI